MAIPIKGELTLDDGDYEGDIVDGKPHGKGELTYKKGDVYKGDFAEGEWHGKGKLTFCSESLFDSDTGEFIRMDGFGDSGDVSYEGDFFKGKMTGKGVKICDFGEIVYEGDFVDNKPHGKGKMTYSDGKVEEGNWKKGKFAGNNE